MNPDMPNPPREALETRLTALLLGELPPEEAAALREIIAKDAPLAALHERLTRAIDMVRGMVASETEPDAATASPPRLSEARREKLLAHFKTVAPKEFIPRPPRREMSWIVPLAATAAALVLLVAITTPNFTKARESARVNSVLNNLRVLEGAKDQWALENKKSPGDVVTAGDLKDYLKGGAVRPVAGENYVLGTISDPVTAEVDAANAKTLFGGLVARKPARLEAGQRARLNADAEVAFVDKNGRMLAETSSGGAPSTTVLTYASTPEEKQASATPQAPKPPALLFKVLRNAAGTEALVPADQSKREAESLGARSAPATPRQEIVLPPSNEQAGTITTASAQGTSAQQGELFFFDSGRGGGIAGGGGIGGGGAVAGGGGSADGGGVSGPAPRGRAGPPSASTARGADGFANPEWAGVPETPLPTSAESSNRFLGRYSLTVQPPGSDDNASAFGLAPSPPSGPNQPTLNFNLETKFTNNGQMGDKALGLGWYDKELEPERRMGIRADLFAGQPSKAKPDVRDGDADAWSMAKLDAPRSVATVNGIAMPQKSVGAAVEVDGVDPTAKPIPQTAPEGVLALNRWSDQLGRKPDRTYDFANQAPVLGEAPEVGPAFAAPPDASGRETKAPSRLEPSAQPQIAGKDLVKLGDIASGVEQLHERLDQNLNLPGLAEARKANSVGGDAVRELDAAGKPVNRTGAASEEAVRRKLPSIVLPPLMALTTDGVPIVKAGPEVPRYAPAQTSALSTESSVPREQSLASVQPLKRELAEEDKKIAQAKEHLEQLHKESAPTQADATPAKPAAPAPTPQPEVQTRDNAYSTFSLNVSDVSFKLAGASLEKGVMPEPATVRSEEFINAFDYGDPEPPPGVPVAFAWGRARYPFAHNRDLLRFSVKTAAAGRRPGRPLNLVLLLDNSGSMERADRVNIIHEALRVLAAQLQPQDKLSVVTFARTARLWVDGVPGSQAGAVAEQISSLTPQGGTNLGDAMDLAYQTALRHYLAGGVNRVVLLTDGAANLGNVDPDALKQKVETHRKQGVALDCFGIGWEGYNDDLLEVLSRNGDGRYGFINTPEEAATEFAGKLAGALHVAVSDVKVQVEFNPGRVSAYRQVGYAKHQLTKEQFRDNTVDAAEIGAAESGNALYVVETNPGGDGPLAIVRVRYKVPGTADYHEHEWAVPFTGNAVLLEQASAAMRLAATASAFSEWLVSSPYAAEVTPDQLLGYLRGVPEIYGADPRPKKLEWMIRQAKTLGGK